ncbi:MAG: hypothetical protein N3F63_06525 [Thermoplasmata archaeon]|nr:hypothetical protein [Thermoplasmata archaeon]
MEGKMAVKTQRYLLWLAVAIAAVALFTQLFPHSFERPVVPDERAYYQWALLYSEGKFAVPVEQWYDDFAVREVYLNGTGIYQISLNWSAAETNGRYRLEGNASPGIRCSLQIRLFEFGEPETRPKLLVETNTTGAGAFAVQNLMKGLYMLEVSWVNLSGLPPVNLLHREIVPLGVPGPYHYTLSVCSVTRLQGITELVLKNSDMLGNPVQNATVVALRKSPHGPVPATAAETDCNGCAALHLGQPGNYVVIANKSGAGKGAIHSVVELDGRFYAVHRWPPGYSMLLAGFLKLGIGAGIGLFFLAVGALGTYFAGRRLFSDETGFFGALLQIFCGTGILLVFEKGMADYATMALGIAGFAMLVESLHGPHKIQLSLCLALAGGLCMGFSVLVRYSSAVLLLAPLAVCLHFLWGPSRAGRGHRNRVVAVLKSVLPFILGLMLVGIYTATYNATYFGSPLNSGYQYPAGAVVVQSDGGNYSLSVSEPETTMFGAYFSPSIASLYNLPNILLYLLMVMPVVFLFPLGLWLYRKNPNAWWLLLYALPVVILYIQLPWVASWEDPTRCIEDTRYFLPALPAIALLTALGITELKDGFIGKHTVAVSLPSLAISGFLAGYSGIALALWRTKTQMEGVATQVTAEHLFLPAVFAGFINLGVILMVYGIAIRKMGRRPETKQS